MDGADIGIDMVEIARFRHMESPAKEQFLQNTFSSIEREYCLSFADPAPHFAGTFAAKEAIKKAYGDDSVALSIFEIRREETGKPIVWVRGERSHRIIISITHTAETACAVALKLS